MTSKNLGPLALSAALLGLIGGGVYAGAHAFAPVQHEQTKVQFVQPAADTVTPEPVVTTATPAPTVTVTATPAPVQSVKAKASAPAPVQRQAAVSEPAPEPAPAPAHTTPDTSGDIIPNLPPVIPPGTGTPPPLN